MFAVEPFAIQRYRAPQNYAPGVWEATVKGLAEISLVCPETRDLPLTREGSDAIVTIPEVDAWAVGYLSVAGSSEK